MVMFLNSSLDDKAPILIYVLLGFSHKNFIYLESLVNILLAKMVK